MVVKLLWIIFHFLYISYTFENSALFKTTKNTKNKSLVFGENDSRCLSDMLQS